MARAGGLIAFGLGMVLAAAAARAAEPCAEGRARTGLVVRIEDGVVVVDTVDPGSTADRQGMRPGDRVLQVNDVRPGSCRMYARAVRRADEDDLALLWLVDRGGQRLAMALDAGPGAPVVAAAPTGTAGGPPTGAAAGAAAGGGTVAPSPALPPTTLPPPTTTLPAVPPLPADVPVSLDSVLAGLGALGVQTRRGLPTYRDAVDQVAREVVTLRAREGASPAVVAGLEQVLRLHRGAAVAWESVEDLRERKGIRSGVPLAENATADFFLDSNVERLLDQFDFLAETVTSEPSGGLMQVAGRWQPVRARTLLWEHAGSAFGQLTAQLADQPAE